MAYKNTDGNWIHDDPAEWEGMRKAGLLAARVLDMLYDAVKPGITTAKLDRLAHEMILDHGAIPAPLGYESSHHSRPFPKSVCTSIDHVVCHGVPGEAPLGDKPLTPKQTVNIDVTVILDGWHGDTSRMFWVGNKVPEKAKQLTRVTYEAMMRGIAQVKPGAQLGDIGHAIQSYIEAQGYSTVRDFCGHGLGREFHTTPNVLHYGKPGTGQVLEEGMFFTIEPMINIGPYHTKYHKHGDWPVVTKGRDTFGRPQLSAQFEHSLAVTKDGYEIFTESPKNWHNPEAVT